MAKLTDEITIEYLKDILQYGEKIENMESVLEKKGKTIATQVSTLAELEGESFEKDGFRVLKECPMVPVLKQIKEANEELTGINAFPGFYADIVKEYIEKNPGEGAILHPLCIVHQIIRKTYGILNGKHIQQVACRSMETGKVVYSETGMEKGGLTEEEADELIQEESDEQINLYACLYLLNEK